MPACCESPAAVRMSRVPNRVWLATNTKGPGPSRCSRPTKRGRNHARRGASAAQTDAAEYRSALANNEAEDSGMGTPRGLTQRRESVAGEGCGELAIEAEPGEARADPQRIVAAFGIPAVASVQASQLFVGVGRA